MSDDKEAVELAKGVLADENIPEFDLSDPEQAAKLNAMVNDPNNKEPIAVRVFESETGDIAYGVAMPKNHPTPTQYLSSLKEYGSSDQDIYDQIEVCRKLYVHEGVVGTVIDMYTDLSFSKFKVTGLKNAKAKELIAYWMRNVNKNNNNISRGIDSLVRDFGLDFYLSGNVFPYNKWGKFRVKPLKDSYQLPMTLIAIDPTIIRIPEDTVQFGNKEIHIDLTKVLGKHASKSAYEDVIKALPTKLRKQAGNGNRSLQLDDADVYHIKRRGNSYSAWGVPYLVRAINAIASKRKVRELDDNTIDGMINSITLYKIGDPKYPETWKPSRLRAFGNLLQNPSASLSLIWSWDLNVEHISPTGDILDMSSRYADANSDILYALGAPLSLLTGSGEKAGDVWASIIFMMERFEEYRQELKIYLEDLIERILVSNGFKNEDVTVKFIKPKINKEDLSTVVLAFYDRGLISKETAIEEAGYEAVEQHGLRESEKKSGRDDVMIPPDLPFTAQNTGKDEDQPEDKKDDKSKKDTDVNEVDQDTKKVTPRLEGTTKDRVVAFFQHSLTHESSTTVRGLRKNLNDTAKMVFNLDPKMAQASFGKDIKGLQDVIAYCTKGLRKSGQDYGAIVLSRIDKYFEDIEG
jgi:hypothetical protein